MAVALAKLGGDQGALRYRATGTGGTGTVTQAQLVSDCEAGPLRQFLDGISVDADWQALITTNMGVTVVGIQELASSDDTDRILASFDTAGAGNRQLSVGMGGGNMQARIEIRFHHSLVR